MNKKSLLIKCALLLGGLYAAGVGLWRLGQSAVFVHEAVVIPGVVVDVRERPFEGFIEMMQHGNLPWECAVAHQPHVRYSREGVSIVDTTLPDLDSRDYNRGDEVEIILHPQKPHMRHLHAAKFIWVAHLFTLALGVLLLVVFWLTRKLRFVSRRRSPRRRREAPVAVVRVPLPGGTEVEAEIPPPTPPKKRRRSSKPKDPSAPAKPRKSSSKSPKDPDAPKKRRRKSSAQTQ